MKKCFKVECLNELSNISNNGFHQLWRKIQGRNCKSFLVCSAYRPPNVPLNCFDEDLAQTVTAAFTFNKDMYILGDCDLLNPASYILQDFCSAFNLTQIMLENRQKGKPIKEIRGCRPRPCSQFITVRDRNKHILPRAVPTELVP